MNKDGTYSIVGKRHCTDGPAVIFDDGTKMWYVNNKRHRTDGPAIEWADGRVDWYVDGKHFNIVDILTK